MHRSFALVALTFNTLLGAGGCAPGADAEHATGASLLITFHYVE